MTYLDASAVMRLVAGKKSLQEQILQLIQGSLVTSTVSLTECLTQPMRDDEEELIKLYLATMRMPLMKLVSADDAIATEAAKLRANFRLKTPDALHFATAIAEGCTQFITADRDFLRCDRHTGIEVILISAIA